MAEISGVQTTPGAMSAQERLAREYLAQARFRKARDEFKQLCKLDRLKFLPWLVEANLGLAREMLGKGMISEVRQLANYLKTIASPEQMLALELELNSPADQQAMLPDILMAVAKPSLSEAERQRLADRAVLASFEPLQNSHVDSSALGGELEAIVSGLQAVSERQFEQALDRVRPLSQSSVFGHWKLFVKGLAAFHSPEREKAVRFFKEVPAASAPGKVSQAYLLLLGSVPLSRDSALPPEAVVETACRIVGRPGCGRALLAAEQAWRKDDPVLMYLNLRKGIAGFPSEGLDLLGVLSEFAVNAPFALPQQAREHFIDLIDETVHEGRPKNAVELQLFLRAVVLGDAPVMPDALAIDFWERFLRSREQLHGPNPAFDSEAYGWLGQMMSQPGEPSPFSYHGFGDRRKRMRNATEARRLLEKAVTLWPNNLSACLSLCEVYKQERQHPQRNRLLDLMAARFPSDKQVLLLAGQGCLERKTFKKGLDYFYQALAVDPLDPAIPDMVVEARLLQAREFFQKKRPDDARKTMQQIAPFELETTQNLARSRWCLKTQQGVLESIRGDNAKGAALLGEARGASPSVAAFLFYAGFIALELAPRETRCQFYFDELAHLAKSEATAADAVLLARVWSHSRRLVPEHLVHRPRKVLEKYLHLATNRSVEREDACRLAEFALAEDWFANAVLRLLEPRLKQDQQDPLLRLYRLRLTRRQFSSDEDDRSELKEIIAEASRRKEDQTVRQARQLLDALGHPPPMPNQPFDTGMPLDDDFEQSWPEQAESFPSLEQLLGGLPGEKKQLMLDFLWLLANASERQLKEFKQTRPAGISAAEFDLLALLARAAGPFPAQKSRPVNQSLPRTARPKPVPLPDRTQPNLF